MLQVNKLQEKGTTVGSTTRQRRELFQGKEGKVDQLCPNFLVFPLLLYSLLFSLSFSSVFSLSSQCIQKLNVGKVKNALAFSGGP